MSEENLELEGDVTTSPSLKKTKKTVWVQTYFESESHTRFLKQNKLPVCEVCGTGYHSDGSKYFCPNQNPDCPMVDPDGNPK